MSVGSATNSPLREREVQRGTAEDVGWGDHGVGHDTTLGGSRRPGRRRRVLTCGRKPRPRRFRRPSPALGRCLAGESRRVRCRRSRAATTPQSSSSTCRRFPTRRAPTWQVVHRGPAQHTARDHCIAAHAHRAADRLGDIRDRAARPTPHLVAERPPATESSEADRAFADDATLSSGDPHRRHLDHAGHAIDAHLERRVEQLLAATTTERRSNRLVAPSTPPDEAASRPSSQRDPVELDAVGHDATLRRTARRRVRNQRS